jgi:hypothetical protein
VHKGSFYYSTTGIHKQPSLTLLQSSRLCLLLQASMIFPSHLNLQTNLLGVGKHEEVAHR